MIICGGGCIKGCQLFLQRLLVKTNCCTTPGEGLGVDQSDRDDGPEKNEQGEIQSHDFTFL